MNTYVILRRNGWSTAPDLEKAAARSLRVGNEGMRDRVRWLRSYVIREPGGRLGTVCVFKGTDAATIREHAERAGLPCDDIIPVAETVIINEAPALLAGAAS
jgi:hypothetical protein